MNANTAQTQADNVLLVHELEAGNQYELENEMKWLSALNKFFKVKDVYDKVGEIRKLHDYGKKVSTKKSLKWDDLKYFKDSNMEAALKNAKMAVKAADNALKVKAIWPDPGTQGRYSAACKAVDRFGHESKEAKSVVEMYGKDLIFYGKSLDKILRELDKKHKLLGEKLKTAKALHQYGRILHDAFMTCAKIPSPSGTAQNATFFSLAQDAQKFSGHMNSLVARLQKLEKKNSEAITEGKQLVADNKIWITWASKSATKGKGELKKNAKAKKPAK